MKPEPASEETFAKVYPALKEAYTASAFDFGNDFGMWQSERTDILRQMLESDKVTREVVARVTHGNWLLPEGEVWAMVLSRRNVDEYINTFRLRPEGVRNCEKLFSILWKEKPLITSTLHSRTLLPLTAFTVRKRGAPLLNCNGF